MYGRNYVYYDSIKFFNINMLEIVFHFSGTEFRSIEIGVECSDAISRISCMILHCIILVSRALRHTATTDAHRQSVNGATTRSQQFVTVVLMGITITVHCAISSFSEWSCRNRFLIYSQICVRECEMVIRVNAQIFDHKFGYINVPLNG